MERYGIALPAAAALVAGAPGQAGADTGADEGGTVGAVDGVFSYGTPADVVLVTITARGGG